MLDLKIFLDEVLPLAFADPPPSPGPSTAAPIPNQDFVYALTDAFHSAFAPRRTPPLAELFAKHLDQLLRYGQKALLTAQYEAKLDGVLGLYRFTGDKDVFRAFYFKALAKRLLLGRSASDDWEKGMVRKLKERKDILSRLHIGRADEVDRVRPRVWHRGAHVQGPCALAGYFS